MCVGQQVSDPPWHPSTTVASVINLLTKEVVAVVSVSLLSIVFVLATTGANPAPEMFSKEVRCMESWYVT